MNEQQIALFQKKQSDHWQTPEDLFKKLDKEFNFTFDPCPLMSRIDYLKQSWGKRCFINPPYSQIKNFLVKADQEIRNGNTELAVILCFSNTDTRWFHDHLYHKAELRFLKGRLKFLDMYGKELNSAMRPSMIAILRDS